VSEANRMRVRKGLWQRVPTKCPYQRFLPRTPKQTASEHPHLSPLPHKGEEAGHRRDVVATFVSASTISGLGK